MCVDVCSDDDVLDTWFSSGLFPFSVLGWPEPVNTHNCMLCTKLSYAFVVRKLNCL